MECSLLMEFQWQILNSLGQSDCTPCLRSTRLSSWAVFAWSCWNLSFVHLRVFVIWYTYKIGTWNVSTLIDALEMQSATVFSGPGMYLTFMSYGTTFMRSHWIFGDASNSFYSGWILGASGQFLGCIVGHISNGEISQWPSWQLVSPVQWIHIFFSMAIIPLMQSIQVFIL